MYILRMNTANPGTILLHQHHRFILNNVIHDPGAEIMTLACLVLPCHTLLHSRLCGTFFLLSHYYDIAIHQIRHSLIIIVI